MEAGVGEKKETLGCDVEIKEVLVEVEVAKEEEYRDEKLEGDIRGVGQEEGEVRLGCCFCLRV